MKKFILSAVFFISSLFVFAQNNISQDSAVSDAAALAEATSADKSLSTKTVLPLLSGVWQGSDRLVRFTDSDDGFYCVLKTFYAWYDDRAAEPASFSSGNNRDKNNTTSSHPEVIDVSYTTVAENKSGTAGVYEINLLYPGEKNAVSIPVAVIGNSIYLRCLIKTENEKLDENSSQKDTSSENVSASPLKMGGFWRSCGSVSGITVSVPRIAKELVSYYFSDRGAVYHIRYWLTEMPFTDDKAVFTDGEKNYSVDKYIQAAGKVYTCVTGRSTDIRNIEKSSDLEEKYILDEDGIVCAFGTPYLVKVEGGDSANQIQSIVAENNKRRHPAQKPLFPPSEVNFHWKEISELEKYNPWTWNRRNIDLGK